MIPNNYSHSSNLSPDKTVAEYDDATELLLMRGDFFVQAGDYARALECYDRALEIQPDCIDAWVGIGAAHLKQDGLADAKESFHKALSIAPGSAKAATGMTLVHYENGDLSKAFKMLRLSQYMEANPEG